MEQYLQHLMAELGCTPDAYRFVGSARPEGYYVVAQPRHTEPLFLDIDLIEDAANGDPGRELALRHVVTVWVRANERAALLSRPRRLASSHEPEEGERN
jgi:hypothetical protein